MWYARNPTTVTLKHEWEISLHKSSNVSYPRHGTAGWIQRAIGMIRSRSFPIMGSLRNEGSHKTSIAVCQGLIEVFRHLPVRRVGSQVLRMSCVYGRVRAARHSPRPSRNISAA